MSDYIPQRGDICWLDLEPNKGKEIGKYRPCLILSERKFNKQMGTLMCCPISTSIRGGSFEVPVAGLKKPSVVVSNFVYTLDFRDRKLKKIGKADLTALRDVTQRLAVILGTNNF